MFYLRRKLRKGIRAVQRGEKLPEMDRVGNEWLTHVQDTVLPIGIHPENDEKLLEQVTDMVMDIVFEGDQFSGNERVEYIETKLKKIKHDPIFKGL